MTLPIYYEKQKKYSFFENLKLNIVQIISILFLLILLFIFNENVMSSITTSSSILSPIQKVKQGHEVFGFAPYWTFSKLDNVDFDVLTTFAYFGIEVDGEGELDLEGRGYQVFQSQKATEIFRKAHSNGVRVVLTLTQMDNKNIKALLDDKNNQKKAIKKAVEIVKKRGIDGINVDFEYTGNPGSEYKSKFTEFVSDLSYEMRKEVPSSRITVSVYASAAKQAKLYDISGLSLASDGIFMMAYDFATSGSDTVIPTAPLNGHKEGKYWYDISSAVDDFLTQMPAEKLILGLPWYGYDYPVQNPKIKAAKDNGYYTYYWWRGYRYSRFVGRENAAAQTYSNALNNNPSELEGWDDFGKVGWRAYKDQSGLWRMIFLDDERSLGIKYDFAKEKKLGGVGVWALGFDHGKTELWALLKEKFGTKTMDEAVITKNINNI